MKSKRSQRTDLNRAVGNGAIHGDHCPDGCPCTEDDRDEETQDPDKRSHHLGLLLKKLLFYLGHKILKAVIAVEGIHEFRDTIRVLESKRNRRKGRPSEGIRDLIEITPRLGVKTAAIGIKNADNRP